MSFVLRTIAAAAFVASSVSAASNTAPSNPTYTPSSSPTNYNSTKLPAPVAVNGWAYDGCVSSSLPTEFLEVDNSPMLTLDNCLLYCSAFQFALVHDQQCFCSNTINSISKVMDSACSTPCPGDSSEACGGTAVALGGKRQAPGAPLFSLYEKAVVPEGDLYVVLITQIYIDICESCVGGTSTCTASTTSTLTGCGCKNPVTPTIPMVTTVKPCMSCGPESQALTLTVPSVCPTASVVYNTPAAPTKAVASNTPTPYTQFTGAAAQNQAGGFVAAMAVAALAML